MLHSADTFEWFAEEGKRAYGRVIPPSNAGQAAPRDQAPGRRRRRDHARGTSRSRCQARKIAPALAAGCTVVSQPGRPDAAVA